jgi:hypothetical protein
MSTPTSSIDFSYYNPPGVYTNPTATTLVAVNNALPTAVALFGLTVGFRNFIQSITINPDTNDTTPAINQTLSQAGINTATVVVTNPNTGQIYTLNTDYTIVNVGGTNGTANALYTVSRVISGHINAGIVVQVSYQYTNAAYYQPQVFYTYNDVVTAYGAPFNTTTGAIQSELTLAAKFAFLNGAYQIMTVAVKPTNPSAPTVDDYYNALNLFYDQALVAIVVCANGSMQPLQQLIQEHVDQQSASRFERRAIIGMDGSVTPVPSSQRIINAQELYDERIALVSPATFNYFAPELNQSIVLGGQFIAAALAGMVMNMSFAQPLTHKVITGFSGVAEIVLDAQKSFESQNGLMVVEMAPPNGQLMWVRHGLTTNNIDLLHREWNIIGQQDVMVYTMRTYMNNSNLIGQPIYDYTLINVKAAAEAALQSLVVNSQIAGYNSLTVRQLITNPDVLEISYNWQPAFPLNYIVLTFGIDLSTGNVTTQGASPNTSDFSSSNNTAGGTTIVAPSQSSINDFGGPSNTLQSD